MEGEVIEVDENGVVHDPRIDWKARAESAEQVLAAANRVISEFLDSTEKQIRDLDGASIDAVASRLASYQYRAEKAEQQLTAAQAALERDRTKVAEGVTAIKDALSSRHWLTEGRGPYEWDDDRWHAEFAAACDEIRQALEPLVKIAADWSNCPKTDAEVKAARDNLDKALEPKP